MTIDSLTRFMLAPPMPGAECEILERESIGEGQLFLARFFAAWRAGAERPEPPDAILWMAYRGEEIAAIGGISLDPYQSDPQVGRLRHIYVRAQFRRLGIAREIVARSLAFGTSRYRSIRLKTDNPRAAQLYQEIGFGRVEGVERVTHILNVNELKLGRASINWG